MSRPENNRLTELLVKAVGDRTQAAFAEEIGVDTSQISKNLTGRQKPNIKTLRKIAEKASNGVTLDMLIDAANETENKGQKKPYVLIEKNGDEVKLFRGEKDVMLGTMAWRMSLCLTGLYPETAEKDINELINTPILSDYNGANGHFEITDHGGWVYDGAHCWRLLSEEMAFTDIRSSEEIKKKA